EFALRLSALRRLLLAQAPRILTRMKVRQRPQKPRKPLATTAPSRATPPTPALAQQVLRTDVAGMPLEWIDYKEAVRLYHMEQVAYTCGSLLFRLHGGTNARSGERTIVDVSSIVATVGHSSNPGTLRHDYIPPLNNETLFKRDAYLCMYCGQRF